MNLLVMENLFYDRRYSKVRFAVEVLKLKLKARAVRFMISRDQRGIGTSNPQGVRMKSCLTRIW